MRRSTKLASGIATCATLGLVACTGGTGTLFEHGNGWDYDKGNLSQREIPTSGVDASANQDPPKISRELPPSTSQDPPPDSVFACSGIFECVATGTSRTCITINNKTECTPRQALTIKIDIALEEEDGKCTIGDLILHPNGTFENTDDDDDGPRSGQWTPYGSGFTISVPGSTVTCVRKEPASPFGSDNPSRSTVTTPGSSGSSGTSGGTSGGPGSGGSSGGSSGDIDVPDVDAGF